MVAWGVCCFVLLVVTAPQHDTLVKAIELALEGRMGRIFFCLACCHQACAQSSEAGTAHLSVAYARVMQKKVAVFEMLRMIF